MRPDRPDREGLTSPSCHGYSCTSKKLESTGTFFAIQVTNSISDLKNLSTYFTLFNLVPGYALNPSSVHSYGRFAKGVLEDARKEILSSITIILSRLILILEQILDRHLEEHPFGVFSFLILPG